MLLYETLSQPLLSLSFFLCGFAFSFIFDLANLFFYLCEKKKWIGVFLDGLATFFLCLLFLLFLNLLHYGEFRFYLLLSFSVGTIAQRIFLGKFLAKTMERVYLWIRKRRIKYEKTDDDEQSQTHH